MVYQEKLHLGEHHKPSIPWEKLLWLEKFFVPFGSQLREWREGGELLRDSRLKACMDKQNYTLESVYLEPYSCFSLSKK